MKRATVTLDETLDGAVQAYVDRQEVPPTFTALVQAALREYLSRRGAGSPPVQLRITAARKGSGKRDVSLHHDRYFARHE